MAISRAHNLQHSMIRRANCPEIPVSESFCNLFRGARVERLSVNRSRSANSMEQGAQAVAGIE